MKREAAQDKRLLLPRRNNFSIQTVSLRCYLYTFIFFITATNFSQSFLFQFIIPLDTLFILIID